MYGDEQVGIGTDGGQGAITRDLFEVVVGVEQHAWNNDAPTK